MRYVVRGFLPDACPPRFRPYGPAPGTVLRQPRAWCESTHIPGGWAKGVLGAWSL